MESGSSVCAPGARRAAVQHFIAILIADSLVERGSPASRGLSGGNPPSDLIASSAAWAFIFEWFPSAVPRSLELSPFAHNLGRRSTMRVTR
ncbi:hypothetical protein PC116_g24655 [Phytophthora cactorum]|uniref:Uncharacterized protein n=1 Tax=Phytophthora cactorum TaxID=29920 RepID=A0A8T0Y3S5_9STRA|nr:hypothetical protein PC113_g20338 [Phytophthora cactorum]KAG2996697.1 hypothetical protein PC120_g21443 [Phytophthora cactorum]KAG4042436.1 hypothetical protein PC123_g22070 [Phytophthora cactorum]KAG4226945.1 hypothetical protein PC116_g24655 [Phytophthora cactorum]